MAEQLQDFSGRAPSAGPCAQEVAEWDADEDAEVGEARVNAWHIGDDTASPHFRSRGGQEQRDKASENWRGIKRVREKMQSEGRWSVARRGYRQRTGRPGAGVQPE